MWGWAATRLVRATADCRSLFALNLDIGDQDERKSPLDRIRSHYVFRRSSRRGVRSPNRTTWRRTRSERAQERPANAVAPVLGPSFGATGGPRRLASRHR